MLTVVLQLLNPCRLVEVQGPVDQPVDQLQDPVDQLQGPVDQPVVDQVDQPVVDQVDQVDQFQGPVDQPVDQLQDLVVDHLVAEALVGEDAGGVAVEQHLIHP